VARVLDEMPTYTFQCQKCSSAIDLIRSVDRRNDMVLCECDAVMQRTPELFRPNVFEPYYDEGLGEDLYSFADKRRSMKELGVVESGDRVGGARNFDKHAPDYVSKMPVRGVRRRPKPVDPIVETLDDNGKVAERRPFSELPDYDPLT
jgi:hypothetical protein